MKQKYYNIKCYTCTCVRVSGMYACISLITMTSQKSHCKGTSMASQLTDLEIQLKIARVFR